jgi:hypothetical protein
MRSRISGDDIIGQKAVDNVVVVVDDILCASLLPLLGDDLLLLLLGGIYYSLFLSRRLTGEDDKGVER